MSRLVWATQKLIVSLAICGAAASLPVFANEPAKGFDSLAQPFLKKYCLECHGPAKQKGELRLDKIVEPTKDASAAQGWSDILDRLALGEMPPKKHPTQPTADETRQLVAWIRESLRQAENSALSRGGRVVMRRLNRAEYENTIRDLLGVEFRVGEDLPDDPTVGGFDNVGAALSMSPLHIERYMKLAEEAIALAVDPRPKRPETELWRFDVGANPRTASDPRQSQSATEVLHVRGGNLAEPHVKRHPPLIDQTLVKTDPRAATNPFLFRFDGEGPPQGAWGTSPGIDGKTNGSDLVRFHIQNFCIREGGEYRIRVRAKCDWDPLVWSHEVPKFQVKPAPSGNRLYLEGAFRAPGQVEVFESRFRVASGERLNLRLGRANYQNALKYNPEVRQPRVWVDWVEIEGPCFDFPGWPSPTQRQLFGDWTATAEPPSPDQLHEIMSRFLSRAFRRPATADEIALRENVVGRALKAGLPPVEAVSLGFISAMTSAPFAYLVEPRQGDAKRPLGDHELASRLSYFIWGAMPDARLREQADAGKLRDSATLVAEARRMLRDPRSHFLCERFASQWLDLSKLSTIAPDPAIYFDWTEPLRADLRAETIAFFAEILYSDLPLHTFLTSDFAMLNDRLAAHYRIPGVVGSHLRPVKLRPEWHRGGLIGQGGLLCLTSNGTRTSPVSRGVFLLERILDSPPPPPPANAGEIDNKVPGEDKVTVRERLAIHRKVESCADCHNKIDPLGFALENYNAIGRWQVRESSGDPNRPYKLGGAVDASGTMPDGRAFENLAEFQTILRAEEERFLRGMAKRMLVFGLGRVVDFGDRALIAELTERLKTTGTLTNLIEGIVASEQFRTK